MDRLFKGLIHALQWMIECLIKGSLRRNKTILKDIQKGGYV